MSRPWCWHARGVMMFQGILPYNFCETHYEVSYHTLVHSYNVSVRQWNGCFRKPPFWSSLPLCPLYFLLIHLICLLTCNLLPPLPLTSPPSPPLLPPLTASCNVFTSALGTTIKTGLSLYPQKSPYRQLPLVMVGLLWQPTNSCYGC